MMIELIATAVLIFSLNKIPGKEVKHVNTIEEDFCKYYGISEDEFRSSILTSEGDRAFLTPEEVALIERVVMSEAGNQTVECQEAVATVILNRWQCPDNFGDTISEVVYAPKQFSTANNGEPTLSVQVAVRNAITYYNTYTMCIPKQVYYFRSGHYHTFGLPYGTIDDLYFSTPEDVVL